jgi:hypothetical protein
MGSMNRALRFSAPLGSFAIKFFLLGDLYGSVVKFFSALSFFVTFVRFVVHSSAYFKISCNSFCTGSGSRKPIT